MVMKERRKVAATICIAQNQVCKGQVEVCTALGVEVRIRKEDLELRFCTTAWSCIAKIRDARE